MIRNFQFAEILGRNLIITSIPFFTFFFGITATWEATTAQCRCLFSKKIRPKHRNYKTPLVTEFMSARKKFLHNSAILDLVGFVLAEADF